MSVPYVTITHSHVNTRRTCMYQCVYRPRDINYILTEFVLTFPPSAWPDAIFELDQSRVTNDTWKLLTKLNVLTWHSVNVTMWVTLALFWLPFINVTGCMTDGEWMYIIVGTLLFLTGDNFWACQFATFFLRAALSLLTWHWSPGRTSHNVSTFLNNVLII